MEKKRLRDIEELKVERINLLTMYAKAKTRYFKDNLHHKIKSVNKQLYTLTKDVKYL